MTAQIPDRLIHRGRTLDLCARPLEPYLKRLRKARRPAFLATSSANWRGHVATGEIIDRRLFLVGIEGLIKGPDGGIVDASLSNCFPKRALPIPATWVSNDLRCPEGRLRSYCHHGFASVYERDRILIFHKGELVDERLIYNPPSPLEYRIEPDGRRVYIDYGEDAPDPFPADQPVEPWRLWGDPNWEMERPDDEGYVLGGLYVFREPRPR